MPRIFSDREREEKRVLMFGAGLELIKRHGYTHASVEKIAKAAGLGKSTFYNFFSSKEDFMAQLIEYVRTVFRQQVDDARNKEGMLSKDALKRILRSIIYDENSVYQYLSSEEKRKILQSQQGGLSPDLDEETQVLKWLFSRCEGVRSNLAYAEISNLLKLLAAASGDREIFHAEGYERMMDDLYALLFEKVFE